MFTQNISMTATSQVKMQIGDLVRFKKRYLFTRPKYEEKLGIILDENPKYYFVSWIGDKEPYVCERKHALELAK